MSDMQQANWYKITEAAHILGVSERSVRRRIEQGEIESKLAGGMRYVKLDTPSSQADVSKDDLIKRLQSEIDGLQKDKGFLQQQGVELQTELKESSNRHDTIVLQLTRQLDQSQRLLEYHQEPFWRRWFKRQQKKEFH